jgi:peptide/nickel transport system substrate-binding protein
LRSLLAGAAFGLAAVVGAGASLGLVGAGAAWAETPPNVLVIANRIDDITSMDPAQSFEFAGGDALRNIYQNLVNFDPLDLETGFQPDVAESWEVSEDGKTITFTIKDGLTFASGNPVRAEDAEFSLRRAVILNKTPAFILTQFGFTPENVEETIKADGNTLTLTLDKPYAVSFVLNCLTATIGHIVDKETVMANETDGDLGNAWLNTNSAGSGPYTLVAWNPNESVTLTANPNWSGDAPAMERVIVRHVQESANQRLLLEQGDIDVARNLNPEDVAAVAANPELKVVDELRGRIMYLGLNQKNEALSNPKVIEAFKYLIDYEAIANSFLKGQYTVHQAFLPQTYLGELSDTPYTLDIEKAKALIAESGLSPEDLTFEFAVRDAQDRIEVAQAIQNTAAQAGITLNLAVATGAQTLARYRARELEVTLEAWGPDYPDPQTNASTFAYNPGNADEDQNTGILAWRIAWDAEGFTERTDAAVIEKDTEKRAEMYRELQRDFQAQAPFVMMFQQIEQMGLQDNVNGMSLGGPITSASYWKVTK